MIVYRVTSPVLLINDFLISSKVNDFSDIERKTCHYMFKTYGAYFENFSSIDFQKYEVSDDTTFLILRGASYRMADCCDYEAVRLLISYKREDYRFWLSDYPEQFSQYIKFTIYDNYDNYTSDFK